MLNSSNPNIVIAAGGLGSRMLPLTIDRQKCMLEICGKPILEHILDNISEVWNEGNIFISERYKADSIKKYFGNKYKNLNIIHCENQHLIGERNSFLNVKSYINGPFFWHDGDVICTPDYLNKLKEASVNNKDYAIFLAAKDGTVAKTHARIKTDGDYAVDFLQSKNINGLSVNNYLTMMDIAYYSLEFYTDLQKAPKKATSHYDVLEYAINSDKKRVLVINYPNKWYHFVVPKDLNIKTLEL